MADKTLDARELRCPLPILKAHQAMRDMAIGEQVQVLTSVHGSLDDFDAFCSSEGHLLLKAEMRDDYFFFVIQCQTLRD